MKPLIVLIASFIIAVFAVKISTKQYDFALSGRIAMAVMLCFTAIGHFAFSKGMSMMIPSVIPFKIELVYLTGIAEILLAIGLLVPKFSALSAWSLIIFLILLLPANIYAAIHEVDYQKGTFNGNGLVYLWFRIPLQLWFIGWTYISALK